MSDPLADNAPHRRYTVTWRYLDGSTKEHRALTNRGPLKAVHLVAGGLRRRRGAFPLDIAVRDDGPPELDDQGVAILSGYACDRSEW